MEECKKMAEAEMLLNSKNMQIGRVSNRKTEEHRGRNTGIAKICNGISIAVICLAAVAAMLLLLGFRPYIVLSGSMEPQIHVGSICLVNTKAGYDDIHVGDIIAYEAGNGALVTHRVITITAQGMETKGDANEVSDGITTTEENFHGKTVGSIPGIGYMVKSVKDIFR